MRPLSSAVVAVLLAAVIGCGDGDSGGDADVTVVATTTQVADLVANVGGKRVALDSILRPNSDPHEYEPRPSDAAALAKADVVFRSGGDLDEWLDEVVDSAGGDAKRGDADRFGASARATIRTGGRTRATRSSPSRRSATRLSTPTPPAAPATSVAPPRYTARLRRLDADVARCIDRVPQAKRKLVTTHDALGYFAARYGIEVIGAVIPSLSTQAQAVGQGRERAGRPDQARGRGGDLPRGVAVAAARAGDLARVGRRGGRPALGGHARPRGILRARPTSARSAPTRPRSPRACPAAT